MEVHLNDLSGKSPNLRLKEALLFSHRFADSNKIRILRIPITARGNLPKFLSSKFSNFAGPFIFLAGIIFFIISLFIQNKFIAYNMNFDGENRLLNVKLKKNSLVLSDKKGFSKTLSIDEFNIDKDKQATIVSEPDLFTRSLSYSYIGLGLLILILGFLRKFKEKRILGLIKS